MSDEIIEKSFQVGTPARLIISNVRGSVTIQPGEAGVIEVKAIKHGNSISASDLIEMSQTSDGTVRVETRSNETFLGLLSFPPKVDYLVRVPQGIHLDASCISSSLNVSGLSGSFKLKTISGGIDVTDLTGPFKLNAVSGGITGSHLAGVLEMGTVSGSVHITASNFPSAEASTVSGDLNLQTPIAEGPYQFGSVSGSVRLLVPKDTHCKVELNSVSGKLRSSLPVTSLALGPGTKVTQVGSGGTAVRLKSVSGGLTIETEGVPATNATDTSASTSTYVPPTPPATPTTPPPAPLSTAEILQRIESGDMTVDDAIKLMKGQS